MARFSDKSIEEIKSKLSIVDVVSTYTQVFHRNGEWIKCPFHAGGNERTPSCKLNLERGSYYCFGCKKHGSMFDFVMKMDKVSYPEAIKILADKAGVELEEMTACPGINRGEHHSKREIDEILSLEAKHENKQILK